MHEPNEKITAVEMMNVDEDEDDGPSTSKRVKRLLSSDESSSSYDDDTDFEYFQLRLGGRLMGNRRRISYDSSDSDTSSGAQGKVFENVDSYLKSITEFDESEHDRIPYYMGLLGDFAKQIQTNLPRSVNYTDEQMETVKKNFILSQLDFLVRENIRRTEQDTSEAKRLSLRRPMLRRSERCKKTD